jgi:hypothetical protein
MQLREGRRPKVRLAQPESRIRFGVVGSKKSKILWGGCLAGALSPEIDLKSNIQVSICWRAAYFHKLDFRIIVPTHQHNDLPPNRKSESVRRAGGKKSKVFGGGSIKKISRQ